LDIWNKVNEPFSFGQKGEQGMWEMNYTPQNLSEALRILEQSEGNARIIAGGTDLVLQLHSGERSTKCLIDITGIESLNGISEDQDFITIGAATPHAVVAKSEAINWYARVLTSAAAEIGSPQIRNRATIGGNVVNAQPAADTALALIALDAEAQIQSNQYSGWRPVADLFRGPGISSLDSTKEILVAFRFAKTVGKLGSAYRRLGKCKSIALPVLCAAVVISMDDECTHIRGGHLVLGPVAPKPLCIDMLSEGFGQQPANDKSIERLVQIASALAHPRDSLLRCSVEYREKMVKTLVKNVIIQALEDARRLH
jgi:CO/xanthine dehydrogenase FAD-binding subunit